MANSNRRIRYEDLNWRIVTDLSNKHVWFEKSARDVLGERIWESISEEDRGSTHLEIEPPVLLKIFWSLLDSYVSDQEK